MTGTDLKMDMAVTTLINVMAPHHTSSLVHMERLRTPSRSRISRTKIISLKTNRIARQVMVDEDGEVVRMVMGIEVGVVVHLDTTVICTTVPTVTLVVTPVVEEEEATEVMEATVEVVEVVVAEVVDTEEGKAILVVFRVTAEVKDTAEDRGTADLVHTAANNSSTAVITAGEDMATTLVEVAVVVVLTDGKLFGSSRHTEDDVNYYVAPHYSMTVYFILLLPFLVIIL
jgi:hypothetical protein